MLCVFFMLVFTIFVETGSLIELEACIPVCFFFFLRTYFDFFEKLKKKVLELY